jgi:hypothetical protein
VKDYRVQAISRISAVGHGARSSWAPPAVGGAYYRPGMAIGGPSSNPITDAIASFQAGALNAAMVGLGVLLIATAVLILISQTSAGAAAGGVGKAGARRGLRAIPGVGILA